MNVFINRIAGDISGAEIYNLNLLKSLKQIKDISVIFSSNIKELNKEVSQFVSKAIFIDPKIPEVATKRQFLKGIMQLPYYWTTYLNLFTKIGQIDVYVFHSMTEKIFLTYLLRGKKIVWVEHGPVFASNRFWFIKYLYKRNSTFVSKLVAVSEHTKKDLLTGGISKSKIEIVSGGIDTKYFSTSKMTKKKFVIGYVGSITKEKGIDIFLSVAKELITRNQSVEFLLVGDGPDKKWSERYVQTEKLQKYVKFVGKTTNVKKYLTQMSLFFFPTQHQEGISLALLEAGAMEVPLLVHDIGGNSEIVKQNTTGVLYKTEDTKKIVHMIENQIHNQKKIQEMAKRQRLYIEKNYSIQSKADAFVKLLHSV